MPIRPERKKLYPPHWEKISRLIIEKAGDWFFGLSANDRIFYSQVLFEYRFDVTGNLRWRIKII